MAKVKGLIKQAEEKLQAVDKVIGDNYTKARELQQEADRLRLNSVNDVSAMQKAQELEVMAKSHVHVAEKSKDERYLAQREIDELKHKALQIKNNVEIYQEEKERIESRKEQLKQRHLEELEQLDRDIDNAKWRKGEYEKELKELEG